MLVQRDRQVIRASRALRGRKDQRATRAIPVILDLPGKSGHKAKLGYKDQLDQQGQKATLAYRVCTVKTDYREHKANRENPDRRVYPVLRVMQAAQAYKVSRA